MQYDHPKLTAIISHLNYEFCCYKYTVYRSALKLARMQKILHTSNIPFKLVLAVLDNIRDATWNYMIPPFQLTSLIRDIYFSCDKLGYFKNVRYFNLEDAVGTLANYFWSIFDPHRKHSISFMEIKVSLLLLCKLPTSSCLITECFNLSMKDNNVSIFCFENFVNILSKTLTCIGEGPSYGSHNIPLIMNQLRQYSNGLNEYQFRNLWLRKNTRFLVYANLLALIKRIEEMEEFVHNNMCTSCQSTQIIGIRFKCQTCKDLSLCIKCFATGFSSNKHKGHRMLEVFSEDLPPKKFSHYLAKLCTIFNQRYSEETKAFCYTRSDKEYVPMECNISYLSNVEYVQSSNSPLSSSGCEVALEQNQQCQNLSSNSIQKLQSIIDRLLQQNSEVEKQLKCVKTASKEEISNFLNAHQAFLIDIIGDIKYFSSCISSNNPTSSTPYRPALKNSMVSENITNENLSHSVNGADINRSYLDASKSDYSLSELSLWFNQKRLSEKHQEYAENWIDTRGTDIANFKLLLNKVKEIVEDSFSDNEELSEATQNLENALDNIIKTEEKRRNSS